MTLLVVVVEGTRGLFSEEERLWGCEGGGVLEGEEGVGVVKAVSSSPLSSSARSASSVFSKRVIFLFLSCVHACSKNEGQWHGLCKNTGGQFDGVSHLMAPSGEPVPLSFSLMQCKFTAVTHRRRGRVFFLALFTAQLRGWTPSCE